MTESRIFDLTNPEDGAGAPYSDHTRRGENIRSGKTAHCDSRRGVQDSPALASDPHTRESISPPRYGNQMAARLERRLGALTEHKTATRTSRDD